MSRGQNNLIDEFKMGADDDFTIKGTIILVIIIILHFHLFPNYFISNHFASHKFLVTFKSISKIIVVVLCYRRGQVSPLVPRMSAGLCPSSPHRDLQERHSHGKLTIFCLHESSTTSIHIVEFELRSSMY